MKPINIQSTLAGVCRKRAVISKFAKYNRFWLYTGKNWFEKRTQRWRWIRTYELIESVDLFDFWGNLRADFPHETIR